MTWTMRQDSFSGLCTILDGDRVVACSLGKGDASRIVECVNEIAECGVCLATGQYSVDCSCCAIGCGIKQLCHDLYTAHLGITSHFKIGEAPAVSFTPFPEEPIIVSQEPQFVKRVSRVTDVEAEYGLPPGSLHTRSEE